MMRILGSQQFFLSELCRPTYSSIVGISSAYYHQLRAAPCRDIATILTQQTRDVEKMLAQCWASVVDGGLTYKPTLVHRLGLLRRAYKNKP